MADVGTMPGGGPSYCQLTVSFRPAGPGHHELPWRASGPRA